MSNRREKGILKTEDPEAHDEPSGSLIVPRE